MPSESPKAAETQKGSSVACDWPTKSKVLDLQRQYRMRYGLNLSQEKILALCWDRAAITLENLPAPEPINPQPARA